MSIIGHRGAAGYEIENTAKSIKKALELRVDVIEIDVRRCASGELVVFHDRTTDRLTGHSGKIGKMTLAELKNLRTRDGQQILTLDEAIDAVGDHCLINLDIKGRKIAGPLVGLLHERERQKKNKLRQFLVVSFNHAELRRVKKLEPTLKIGLLYHRHILNVQKKLRRLTPFSVHFNSRHVSKRLIQAAHRLGVKCFIWTVNDPAAAKHFYQLGADGLISDYPDLC